MSIQNELVAEQEQDLLQEARETDAEVAIFMLVDRQPSGMIREGTENQPEPDELMAPGFRSVITTSKYRKAKPKQQGGGYQFIPIRYRSGSTSIDPKVQDKDGVEDVFEKDRILFKNGRLTVVNDGETEGLFKYMRKASFNATNPDRVPSVPEVWKEIFPEKENEDDIDGVFATTNALKYLEALIIDMTPGKYKYDEQRLKALAQYHRVVAETNGGLLKGLMANAQLNPKVFLEASKQFEEESMTEVSHAEKLGVIKFEANRVILIDKNEVLHSYSDKLNDQQKYRSLAAFLSSPEGMAKRAKFTTELKLAKERNANK